ncbi:MAG TPA: tetratricopeptide repeat protein [Dongiaceae bacterium]|nr:tetratricopeptide repeat protein [Dongiaceae bacterium]
MRRIPASNPPQGARAAAAVALLVIAALAPACRGRGGGETGASAPAPTTDPAQSLYNQGKYTEALPLLEKSAAGGKTGTLLYQIGFARGAQDPATAPGVRHPFWTEARPLLEKEIAEPGGATLDRLYYLAVIAFDDADLEGMEKFARQAVATIEKGEAGPHLTGEDWFRLARLHDFLREPSEAEASYRRALSAFRKVPALNPTYQALTLARVADLDYDSKHFEDALAEYDEALKIAPTFEQVKPFRRGVALLLAGRADEAIAAFKADRDPQTLTEAQYAADLALKAKAVGGIARSDTDGTPLPGMALDGLDERVRDAGKAYKAAREKNSYKPGDALPAEVADQQKRFVSLLVMRLAEAQEVQEFCLKEGIAELVRR